VSLPALIGLLFCALLPEEHLSTDTKDVVKLGIALIATMSALVLDLLIASAKSTYDTRRNQLLQISADIILLDRALANFGAEIKDVRPMLQRSVAIAIEQFWSGSGERLATVIEEHPRSKLSLTISSNFRRTARLSARCKIRP
jgi:hypothetical protein